MYAAVRLVAESRPRPLHCVPARRSICMERSSKLFKVTHTPSRLLDVSSDISGSGLTCAGGPSTFEVAYTGPLKRG